LINEKATLYKGSPFRFDNGVAVECKAKLLENGWGMKMEHRVAELHKVRSLLASSNSEDVRLEEKIRQAKDFVRQNYPQAFDQFNEVAIEPSQTKSSLSWPGGTVEEFEVFILETVNEQSRIIDANRINAVTFLDGLIARSMK
jgi:hypothetical protein